jgi:hypothetical protein
MAAADKTIKRTVITRDQIELEQSNGEPFAQMVKAFLLEGQDPSEELLAEYDVNVKVQRLDRRGRPEHGVKFRGEYLVKGESDIFDDILDDLGPGRYNFFIEYRKAGTEGPDKVVVVRDLPVGSQQPAGMVNPPEREDSTLPALQLVMQSMQESNKLLMGMVTAIINKNPGSDAANIVDAIHKGIELGSQAANALPIDGDEVDGEETTEDKLLDLGIKIFELAQKAPEGDPLRKVVTDQGLDPTAQIPPAHPEGGS